MTFRSPCLLPTDEPPPQQAGPSPDVPAVRTRSHAEPVELMPLFAPLHHGSALQRPILRAPDAPGTI
eukprot:1913883-Rhodomonas_salina.1